MIRVRCIIDFDHPEIKKNLNLSQSLSIKWPGQQNEAKFRMSEEQTIGHLICALKKKYTLHENDAIYCFVKLYNWEGRKEVMPAVSQTIGELYNNYANADILHIIVRKENTFGSNR